MHEQPWLVVDGRKVREECFLQIREMFLGLDVMCASRCFAGNCCGYSAWSWYRHRSGDPG